MTPTSIPKGYHVIEIFISVGANGNHCWLFRFVLNA
jgi:hypothetical protein